MFIYNAFIRTTDHCRVQTAFVSLFYIFINMKPWSASNSSVVVVGLLLIMQISKLFHWKATPTRAFNQFLYEFLRIFLISENSLKFVNFFCWGNEFSIYVARHTRSRRSDAPKQYETRVPVDRRSLRSPEPADCPDVLDYSGTHHAPPTTGRRVATTRPHRPSAEPRSTDCWDEATVGSNTRLTKT